MTSSRLAPTANDEAHLRGVGFLVPFGNDAVTALLADTRMMAAAPFQTLFAQDEAADSLWVVVEGTVGLVAATSPHESCVIDLAGPGQTVGEAGLFDTGRYPAAAHTLTEARLARIPAASILAHIEANPALRRHLLGFLSIRLHTLVRQIARLRLMSAPQRLGDFLLGLAGRGPGPRTVHLACERRMIADLLGMTPESLSRALARLAKLGVHSQGRRDLVIDSPQRLRAFVAGE